MERDALQQLLRIQHPATLHERLLDVLEQTANYDSAAILQAQPSGEWAISAWRYYDRWVPIRLVDAFRSRIEHDPLFGQAYSTKAITPITTKQRSVIWRHAQSWIAVPLLLDDAVVAMVSLESITVDAFPPSLVEALQDVSPWMALALDNAGQISDLHQTSTTMTQIHETESDAVADVLHDDIADVLSLIKKSLLRSKNLLGTDPKPNADAVRDISQAIQDLNEAVENARRLSHGLGARRLLDRFDLLPALEILVDNFSRQAQIEVEFTRELPAELHLDPAVKVAIYRVVQEGLTNVSKYAAVDVVELKLTSNARTMSLQIRDEGRGFDISTRPSGIGLTGMRQRTLLHGGKFDLYSQPGQGTHILAEFPLDTQLATRSVQPEPERVVMNLIAFARLYGYIRYFHPRDTAAYADWDQIVIEGVQLVENAETDAILRERLLTLFAPITPDLEVDAPDNLPVYSPRTAEDYVMVWRHHGFGVGNSSLHMAFGADTNQIHAIARMQQGVRDSSPGYLSEREIHPADALADFIPTPNEPLIAPLTNELACRLPMALYTQVARQSPQDMLTAMMSLRTQHYQIDDDQTQGLAAVIILWNVFQHFYARLPEDWDAHLQQALHLILGKRHSIEQVLRLLVAQLQDDAARVRLHHARDDDTDKFAPPFFWAYIEGQVIITRIVENSDCDLRVGDVVKMIDGIPTETMIADTLPFISGTLMKHRQRDALRHLWRGACGSYIVVDVRRDGELHYQRVARNIHSSLVSDRDKHSPREVITELDDEIIYLDLARLQAQQLLRAISRIQMARGLILDARRVTHTNMSAIELLTEYLIESPVSLMEFKVPKIYRPNRQHILFQRIPVKTIEPQQMHLNMPVAVLVDHRCRGRVELYLHLLQGMRRGVLIGQASAGTLGSTDLFTILDAYDVSWTVTQVEELEHTPFTGVYPDILCEPTYAGLQSGKDELLERAIDWMRNER